MGKAVAVNGMTLQQDNPIVLCNISIVDMPSIKVKGGGNGVYPDGTQISVSNITAPSAGASTPDPLTYIVNLNATGSKVKISGDLVLREGDKSDTINANPLIPGTPPVPFPVSFAIEIIFAGQIKVGAL